MQSVPESLCSGRPAVYSSLLAMCTCKQICFTLGSWHVLCLTVALWLIQGLSALYLSVWNFLTFPNNSCLGLLATIMQIIRDIGLPIHFIVLQISHQIFGNVKIHPFLNTVIIQTKQFRVGLFLSLFRGLFWFSKILTNRFRFRAQKKKYFFSLTHPHGRGMVSNNCFSKIIADVFPRWCYVNIHLNDTD